MGYSESIKTIENRRHLLGPLLEGQTAVWDCPLGSEREIAYQIRECFHVARKNPHLIPELQRAANEMEVFIVRSGRVATRWKSADNSKMVIVTPTDLATDEPREQGEQTINSIIQRWIDARQEKLYFSEASLNTEDLQKLHKWAIENGVLIFWAHPSITLQKHTDELAPFAFDPEEDLI